MPTTPTAQVDQYDLFNTWKARTNENIIVANQARSDIGNADGVGGLAGILTTNVRTSLVAAINEHDAEIGDISVLSTTNKTNLVGAVNEVQADCGEPVNLTTTAKSSVVAAVNEHDVEIGNLLALSTVATTLVGAINEVQSELGDITALTTLSQLSVVGAVNEVQSETNTNASNIAALAAEVGLLSILTTTDKSSVINAINEVQSETNTIVTNVGDLATLATTVKTSIVNAINEVRAEVNINRVKSSVQTPLAGFAITVADDIHTLVLTPVGTLAGGTITFPANPLNDDRLTISSSQEITTLTLSGNTKTILGGLTTMLANGFASWHYIAAGATWYRIG